MAQEKNSRHSERGAHRSEAPTIELPRGGGAIRGIGEKFAANAVTGTASISVPIATSPGRSGFGPDLALSYDSGSGNGPFGLGWSLSLPAITRRTDHGLPQYRDAEESDVYLLAGADDLVPLLRADGSRFEDTASVPGFLLQRYRPRIEGRFARIERWTHLATGDVHWRSITQDNVTTLYGAEPDSRITDAASNATAPKIFSWLVCASYDDKGNAIVYEYAQENGDGVDPALACERNRVRGANRYVKRIRYGNRVPNRDAGTWAATDPRLLPSTTWMFEVVFDYDEGHYAELPLDGSVPSEAQHRYARVTTTATRPWSVRPDPFSAHRATFEVRTYRRCQRVLLFHHIPDAQDGTPGYDGLVRATEFDYTDLDYSVDPTVGSELEHQGSTRFASFLQSVTQCGFLPDATRTDTYLKRSIPPLEFRYRKALIDDEVHELDSASLENLPVGLDGTHYRWVDVDGEGVCGILTEQGGAWFYKPNLGGGDLGEAEILSPLPTFRGLASEKVQLLDVSGNGRLDVVDFDRPAPGFFARTEEATWAPFRSFRQLPPLRDDSKNLRFVDLDGDGLADVLVAGRDTFTWYRSLGEQGFEAARLVSQSPDEERGPRLVFNDGEQSIHLSDMCGDGLADLVRIRNGEVCYWPNLGYGRFGAKVTLDNVGHFDRPDAFDPARIRLADVDGSGTTDIVYLARDGARVYFNQCGNRLSEARVLPQFPLLDSVDAVSTVDLLGNGTSCLVWSSPLPGSARGPLRYVDLMSGIKPHLLVFVANNLGAETSIEYAPSTKFYLADKQAGKPWITRLPFPVHVIERVIVRDRVSGNLFVTRYAYHHGFYDGVEREFRGFGLVEQYDTEQFATLDADGSLPDGTNIETSSHIPPVLTKTWFHTGVYLGRQRVSDFFAGLLNPTDTGEYYREPGLTDDEARELLLEDTLLPDDLTVEEEREACRALKGSMLRQETYALDGSSRQPHPYAITERNYSIQALQRRGANRYGVFLTHERESLVYHYERDPADPRVEHALVLEVDEFGHALKAAAVTYGRRLLDASLPATDQAKQSQIHVRYVETRVTNAIDLADDHRTPMQAEQLTYELTGVAPSVGTIRFSVEELLADSTSAAPLQFEETATGGTKQKRLVEHVRSYYRRDDLSGALALGQLESLALPFDHHTLAFTPGLVAAVYGTRVDESSFAINGGYVHSEGEPSWWSPAGRVFYSPGAGDTVADELSYARKHFFLTHRYRDPFHTNAVSTERFSSYDEHDLLLIETHDVLGNLTRATGNYRTLLPQAVTDMNGNRSAAAFDALGLVVGTAVMGKSTESLGDSFAGFEPDLVEAMVLDHLQDPFTNPHDLLRKATSRLVYDAHAYYRTRNATAPQPVVLYSLVRETHDSELPSPQLTAIQHAFHYSDGFGRAIQTKIQAESGAVPTRDATGRIILDADHLPVMSTSPALHRWVGTGWTVFDNKAQPVRQYEPFFSDTQHFESDVRIGVSPVVLYDPLARPLATLHPDHSWEKVLSTPWRRESWDVNDTLLLDPSMDPDVAAWFQRLPAADYLPTWHGQRIGGALGVEEKEAAEKAAVHAATPTIAHLDSRGRVCVTVAKNRYLENNAPVDEDLVTRVDLDIDGNELAVVDAAARVVARYDYDVAATRIHESSMDAGERWLLNDATGNALYAWDSRNHQLRNIYDALRRRIESRLTDGMNPESVVLRTVYGENQPNAESQNLRGKVFQSFDQAGLVTSERYDFKGNLLTTRRQFVGNYKTTVDWLASPALEAEVFTTTSTYDAINRVRTVTTPDSSVFTPSFNEANLLERIDIKVRGAAVASPFVTNIDRDAKGHRSKIEYANGTRTEYSYDRKTFLLRRLHTIRTADNAPLQDFNYTYDPAGNITHIRDDSQQTIYYNNQAALPESDYTYDAIYRLIASEGREHIGQAGQPQTSWNDEFRIGLPHPGDGTAMRRYSEAYELDAAGNLVRVRHQANGGNWTRAYHYNEPSLIDAASMGNRLSSTQVGANLPEAYTYDAHGNVSSMPHLTLMQWDFADRLQATARQVVNAGSPETTYYVYDSSGARVRKVTERQNGTRKSERLSIGSFERYSDYDATGAQATLSRESLQVMDDHQRVAIIETRVTGNDGSPPQLTRYQLANHQGSVALELDSAAAIVSYEEYYAYGSTSYQARGLPGAAAKRYRYAGMERDEESGFAHHGARYYAPWLARWTSADPIGIDGGLNLYEYASDRPTALVDPEGTQPKRQLWLAEWGKFKITPAATRTGRGISKPQRAALRGLNDAFGPGPRNQKMHWGHPANQTHGTTPAGQRPPLKPQLAGENMSQGATVDKATKARAKQQGQFTRDAKGVDRTAPKGKKYNGSGPPDDPFVKEMADYEKSIAKRKPPKTTPRADPPPSRAPVHEQLELPLEKPAVPAPKPAAPEPKPTGSRSGLGGKIVGYAGAAGLVGDALVQLHEGHPGEAAKNVGIAGGVGFVVSKVPALAPLAIMAGTISAYDDDVKEHANSAGSWVEDHTGSRTLGAVSASVEATGESVFQGTFGTVGRGIGQGAAVLYIRATSDDYTIIPWKTQIWSDIFD